VGRVRGTGLGGGNDEREQTLNQILAEMDGFEPGEAVVVLAATNRPDVLDPALLRPGRFDRKVTLELPQRQARAEILAVHCRNKPLHEHVNLDEVAATTVGFSGADLANIVNEAALSAARNERDSICQEDFLTSRDKVLMGAPRGDLINPSERERIACHEAGHALGAWFSPASDPLEKISIVPRGRALGFTEQIPTEDRHNVTEDYLRSRLVIMLAGRCAEKLRFGNYSTGAEDDLKQATRLAYKMVGQWGMAEKLGAVGYSISEEHPFLGRDITAAREFGDDTARLLDEEVRQTLGIAENTATELLEQHRQHLQSLVAALLERETLHHDEIAVVFGQNHG
jgi:cell division protease FtsH